MTRLWAQRVEVAPNNVTLLGRRRQLLNSSGLWWAPSFVAGGSLIEGPEMLRRGKYYCAPCKGARTPEPQLGLAPDVPLTHLSLRRRIGTDLFFAAGRFCTASYAEGVARATSVWGPFETLGVPLLATGLAGYSGGAKITGPGHASYVADAQGRHFAVYHASRGDNCQRFPFVSRMRFTSDGWPYIDWSEAAGAERAPVEPPPVEEQEPEEEAAGCRIVAPCDRIADEPSLRAGELRSCAGQPSRRLGTRDGGVVPVCAVGGAAVED